MKTVLVRAEQGGESRNICSIQVDPVGGFLGYRIAESRVRIRLKPSRFLDPADPALIEAVAKVLARRDGWEEEFTSMAACAYEEMARAALKALVEFEPKAVSDDN